VPKQHPRTPHLHCSATAGVAAAVDHGQPAAAGATTSKTPSRGSMPLRSSTPKTRASTPSTDLAHFGLDLARSSPQLAADHTERRCSGRSATRAATTAVDTAEEIRGRRPGAHAPPLAARRPGRHAAPARDPHARGRRARRRRLPHGLCPTAGPGGGKGRRGGVRWGVGRWRFAHVDADALRTCQIFGRSTSLGDYFHYNRTSPKLARSLCKCTLHVKIVAAW
jgi:hypothetical protein